MVMESEVVGDEVSGGGDEEALKIPEMKIMVLVKLCFVKHLVPLAG
jgi:hypothetical protein